MNIMLHIGLGSFHRAHQAVYLHRLRETGDRSWAIVGGNSRPDMAETMAALIAQQGRYTLETVTPAGVRAYETITAIQRVIPYAPDLRELIAVGADPDTHIVSFTVTEAGYYLDAQDRLDLSAKDLAADLEAVRAGLIGSTIYAVLTSILRARMTSGAGPVTLLNCDNLRHNGDRSRGGLMQFIALAGDEELASWVEANTSSPNAMVDRITPRPTPDVAERVAAAAGWADAAPVTAESFIQWVIEDRFVAGRPAWEKVGVEMVASVQPYEEAKIRILNATHSCIAWAGTLAGMTYIHEGTHDPEIRGFAHAYVTDDVIPCLHRPDHAQPDRPGGLPRCRARAFQQPGDPRQQPARGDGRLLEDPGLHPADPDRTPVARREHRQHGDAAGAVPGLPAALAPRADSPMNTRTRRWMPLPPMPSAKPPTPCSPSAPTRTLWGPLAGDPRLLSALRSASERVSRFAEARSSPWCTS